MRPPRAIRVLAAIWIAMVEFSFSRRSSSSSSSRSTPQLGWRYRTQGFHSDGSTPSSAIQ